MGELISKTEKDLTDLRNFGQKSKQEINDRLEALGLSLAFQVKDGEEKWESVKEEEEADMATRGRVV